MDKPEFQERLDIDPRFQGVWYLDASSTDEGRTLTTHQREQLCRVFATKIKMANGNEMVAEQIFAFINNDGKLTNLINFMGMPEIWIFTDMHPDVATGALLQVGYFEDGLWRETARALCTVQV